MEGKKSIKFGPSGWKVNHCLLEGEGTEQGQLKGARGPLPQVTEALTREGDCPLELPAGPEGSSGIEFSHSFAMMGFSTLQSPLSHPWAC